MRRTILPLALALLVLVGAPALCSIPEIPDPDDTPFDGRQLVMARKCEVRAVGADRTLLLYDELDQKTFKIQLDKKVKVRAASKKQFGRKKLAFADFAKGQRIKVNIRKSDARIIRIDVLPRAEK